MELTAFITLCRLLAVSQVLLTFTVVLRSPNPVQVRAVFGGLGFGAASYLVLPLMEPRVEADALFLPVLFSNAIPLFLWAACHMFFNDEARLPRTIVLVGAVTLALVGVAEMRGTPTGSLQPLEQLLLRWLPQVLKLGFAVLAIRVAMAGYDADLVAPRRSARRWFAIGLGAVVAIVIATELATAFRVPGWLEAVGMLLLFALTFALNLALFPVHPAFGIKARPALAPASEPTAASDPLLAKLEARMREGRAYADHDLRIGGLAASLGVPEHRLRRAINGQLGYRNFNQYVNGYRIDAAAERLLIEPDLPILTIALDVGFRSLSAFNKAFRDLKGCTPTEYRLTDSEKT